MCPQFDIVSGIMVSMNTIVFNEILIAVLMGVVYSTHPPPYIEYRPGELNIILTCPHGGHIRPSTIPDRTTGCWRNKECYYVHGCQVQDYSRCKATVSKDLYSFELTNLISDELYSITGKRPHVVINNLHRKKLDMNREMDLATFGNVEAIRAYQQYTRYVEQAKNVINGKRQRGLLLDIHGVAAHKEQWIELGYRVGNSQLNSGNYGSKYTSIKRLADRACGRSNLCFKHLVSGPYSLGGMLQRAGYKTIPSPAHPKPGTGGYYWGGYTVDRYGSKNGGNVDAIQIETPSPLRNAQEGPRYAKTLAGIIWRFYAFYYK